jgi:uncharacterized membrane protein
VGQVRPCEFFKIQRNISVEYKFTNVMMMMMMIIIIIIIIIINIYYQNKHYNINQKTKEHRTTEKEMEGPTSS